MLTYANITVGHQQQCVRPRSCRCSLPIPERKYAKTWMCHEISPLYTIMMLPFFGENYIFHYSPPCFPSPPVYTPNQSTDHVSRPALRLAQIQRQTFFQRTAADDSDSSVVLKKRFDENHPRSRSPFVHNLLTNFFPILESLQLFWLVGTFPVKIATD